jgi:ribA/ribD-fused uncharacterized protein
MQLTIRSVTDLIDHIDRENAPKYLHFWGHQPESDGSIGKGCLSQWFEAPFDVDGRHYRTAEHFMMAEKARLFGDEDIRAQVLAARAPAEAKKLGRRVKGFTEQAWLEARFDIVVRGSTAKFGQNEALRAFLVCTGDRVLVEASPVDSIWGIGLACGADAAGDPRRWRGLNLLGFALMQARDALQDPLSK